MTKRKPKGALVTDPFCGRKVDSKKALRMNWEGKDYYFCSEGCRRAFDQAPPGVAGF